MLIIWTHNSLYFSLEIRETVLTVPGELLWVSFQKIAGCNSSVAYRMYTVFNDVNFENNKITFKEYTIIIFSVVKFKF